MSKESAAILTIKKPGAMTARSRKAIAQWLMQQAGYLLEDGKDYTRDYTNTGNYTARYLYSMPEARK